jgi:hypothetical protein
VIEIPSQSRSAAIGLLRSSLGLMPGSCVERAIVQAREKGWHTTLAPGAGPLRDAEMYCSKFILVPGEDFRSVGVCVHDVGREVTRLSLVVSYANRGLTPEPVPPWVYQWAVPFQDVARRVLEENGIQIIKGSDDVRYSQERVCGDY